MITYGISPDTQNLVKKFLQEAFSRIGNMQRMRDFLCLSFSSLFCRALQKKTTELILIHDGSYKTVLRREVLFGDYKI